MTVLPSGLTPDQFSLALYQLNPAYTYRFLDDNNYEWRGPGNYPGDVAVQNAWSTVSTSQTADNNLRTTVLSQASSAVGVNLTNLTATQVRALLAILLWKAGAIDTSGNIRSLAQWVR